MIVGSVNVLLHLAGQRWSDFTAAGFAFYVRSISVELCFKIDKHRTTCGEFIVSDGLLKFRVAPVHFGVECSGVKFLSGHSKLVNERQVKTAEALYGGIASGFRERHCAATRNENRGGTEKIFRANRVEFI
jgi:hypothetical protein